MLSERGPVLLLVSMNTALQHWRTPWLAVILLPQGFWALLALPGSPASANTPVTPNRVRRALLPTTETHTGINESRSVRCQLWLISCVCVSRSLCFVSCTPNWINNTCHNWLRIPYGPLCLCIPQFQFFFICFFHSPCGRGWTGAFKHQEQFLWNSGPAYAWAECIGSEGCLMPLRTVCLWAAEAPIFSSLDFACLFFYRSTWCDVVQHTANMYSWRNIHQWFPSLPHTVIKTAPFLSFFFSCFSVFITPLPFWSWLLLFSSLLFIFLPPIFVA